MYDDGKFLRVRLHLDPVLLKSENSMFIILYVV